MAIYILEYPHGASDNILNFVCYYNLARYLGTEVYFDWNKNFVNFPLRPKFRATCPINIPHYSYEYFFTNLDKEVFVESLAQIYQTDSVQERRELLNKESEQCLLGVDNSGSRVRDFSVSSMDWAGVPLLTYLLRDRGDVFQTVVDTTSLFFSEYCDLDLTQVDATRDKVMDRPLIGVHVRYGDSLIGGEAWKAYEDDIKVFYTLVKAQIAQPSNVFLVSDCKQCELIEYVKNILGREHHYIAYSSEPKHSMHSIYEKSDLDEFIFDIMFLSRCDRIYASPNSNVSRLAIFLAYARKADVPVYYVCPFSKTVDKLKGLPSKRYNAWKFDGKW